MKCEYCGKHIFPLQPYITTNSLEKHVNNVDRYEQGWYWVVKHYHFSCYAKLIVEAHNADRSRSQNATIKGESNEILD